MTLQHSAATSRRFSLKHEALKTSLAAPALTKWRTSVESRPDILQAMYPSFMDETSDRKKVSSFGRGKRNPWMFLHARRDGSPQVQLFQTVQAVLAGRALSFFF